ncbi:MAG: hypothetical protein QQN46_09660, partial [Nitrosopumilus sp.]
AGSYVVSGISQVGFIKHDDSGNFIFEDLIQPGDLPASGYDLDDLGDVSVSGATNNQVLTFNSTSGDWEAVTPTAGVAALNDLSDVTLTAEAEGEFLRLNGSGQFVNVTIVDDDVPNVLTLTRINDVNGNEILDFFSFANAVNEVRIRNATTGNPVHIDTRGDDDDVSLRL